MVEYVQKRDGSIVDYDLSKIALAIGKAGNSTNEFDKKITNSLTKKVDMLISQHTDNTITVEEIQDIVEATLLASKYKQSAKSYILYRDQHAKLRNVATVVADTGLMDQYLDKTDWQVNENSNMTYSLQGLNNYISSEVTKKYWLNKVYSKNIRELHSNGDIHIHDLNTLAVYCVGWDLHDLLVRGYGGVPGKIYSSPAKHLRTALGQAVNFLYTLQGECYSDDTEVLTDSGWKFFNELSGDEKFITRNIKTQSIELQYAINHFKYFKEGKLINFKNGKLDLLVTEDHNMVVLEKVDDGKTCGYEFNFIKAKDFDPRNNFIPTGPMEPTQELDPCKVDEEFINYVDYTGYVYCVEVPNHTLYVRRNGKATWCGNCAGAQAFSNFDTLLAPFIRYDNLTYEDVKQAMQEFVFNVNVPTRVGFQCLSEDTEILTHDGWKTYKDISIGTIIATFNLETQYIEYLPALQTFAENYSGKMYNIKNRITDQLISPRHNVVRKKFNTKNNYVLEPIEDILNYKSDIIFPVSAANGYNSHETDISDEFGADKFKGIKFIPEKILHLNKEQSRTFLETYITGDDHEGCKITTTNESIKDALMMIAVNAGYGITAHKRKPTSSISKKDQYTLRIIKHNDSYISKIEEVEYSGIIWCPTTKNQTVVARRNGKVFITGNSPFSNITMDLKVPPQFKDLPVIIGGKPQKETYSEFQPEMDIINSVFTEVMTEGDSMGSIFTFPIPTYNITKDFDWDNENLDGLWEMTAKYGIPYFSNFINSDMKPEDSRSMCCRLKISTKTLEKRGGGLFGANPLTGCYSSDTEVLTNEGWKLFTELNHNEKVLSRDTDTGIASWNKPTEYFEYDYTGNMIHFTNKKGLDLLVTPDHRMLIEKASGSTLIKHANDVIANDRIPKKCTIKTRGISEDDIDFYNFAVAFSSDGSLRNRKNSTEVILCAKKDKKLKLYKQLAENLKKYEVNVNKSGVIIYSKELEERLQKECYINNAYTSNNKKLPNIWNATDSQMEYFMEILLNGDGHIRKTNGQKTFYTVSKTLADDVQKMALYNKMSATITSLKLRESTTSTGHVIRGRYLPYVVYINESNTHRLRKHNIKNVDYTGKVYCLKVANGIFYVRRNGKACWSGNSIGVVTINLPRLGFVSSTKDEFIEKLLELVNASSESLEIKRKVLENYTGQNLYPYIKHYLQDIYSRYGQYWKNHFSTIGIVGMNEACLNLIGEDIASENGMALSLEICDVIRNRLIEIQETTGNNYNFEATPAEGTSYRLALMDKKKYPGIICANESDYVNGAEPFYTNSTQLPVDFTDDIFEVFDLQDDLQQKYTGGTVIHIYVGEKIDNHSVVKNLVKKLCENYHTPYFTITPTFSICSSHGYISGNHETCPTCGGPTEVYSRVTGYVRPITQWNAGKKEEFKNRTLLKI